jgi:hypothetical protein
VIETREDAAVFQKAENSKERMPAEKAEPLQRASNTAY